MSTHEAGKDVDAHCTKCRLELAHVIIAMSGPRIARVQCKTCGGVHAYRSKTDAAKPKRALSTRTASRTKAGNPPPLGAYDDAIRGRDLSRARRYRISERFESGEILDHRTFGVGVVTKCIGDDKLEVLFAAGAKVLIQGRAV